MSRILNRHTVPVVVAVCMDFRFHPHLVSALRRDLEVEDYDLISIAGGAGNLARIGQVADHRRQTVLEDILLAVEAHRAQKVVVLNHQNCGRYARMGHIFADHDSEFNFHNAELARAIETLNSRLPGEVEIVAGYFHANGDGAAIRVCAGEAVVA